MAEKQGDIVQSISFRLARNSFYNLATQVVMMGLGLWAIPKIVHGISDERFGLLSLVWAFLGYFSLLDLGISRAATKFLVDSLAEGSSERTRSILSASLQLTLLIGLMMSFALWALAPFLVTSVFSVGGSLRQEALTSLYWTSFALPFVLISGVARAAQMAYQRFDIMNVLQGALGIVQWIGSVVVVRLGYGLVEIVALSVVARLVTTIAGLLLLPSIGAPKLTIQSGWSAPTTKRLFGFGGWVTVSQIIGPLFQYMDRFLIGSLLTLSAVTYYAVPQEILSRLLVIPLSLSLVLFPVLSQGEGSMGMSADQSKLYMRSMKYLFFMMFPITLMGFALASDFLRWWVGPDFAQSSSVVLQILSVGFLFNALAQMPATALQAAGHPNVMAKFHMLEILPTLGLAALLISFFGLVGAACAFTTRVIIDCLLLSFATHRLIPASEDRSRMSLFHPRHLVNDLLFISIVILLWMFTNGILKAGLLAVVLIAYSLTLWFVSFDDTDRAFFLKLRTRFLGGASKG